YVTNNTADALSKYAQKSLKGAKILLLGIAYKKNLDDMRESPSVKIWERFEEKGTQVDYYDNYIPAVPKTRKHLALYGRKSIELTPEDLTHYDAVFVATDHDGVDYQMIADHSSLIVDSRNAFERNGITADHIIKT